MSKTKSDTLEFDIPEDFKEKYRESEFYSEIRDSKTVYALTTFPRVIPYEKDGLIEVYRKALWNMYNSKLFWVDRNHVVKSATIVGDIIGKWHPHGDQAAYQSMVTLAQPFTNNQPLIYGSGNWGNIIGDPAASMRYTECCLSEFFCDSIEEIKPEIVDFQPNFDGKQMEPQYIPFKIPILLVNGSYGIADSYITSIPPHNLNDVVDICIKFLHNKNIRNEILVDGFFPDFPNYGIVTNKSEIENFYKMDIPGNIKMKATIEIDRINNKLFIRDLPYNVTQSDIKMIIKQQHEKKHAVLSKVYDIIDMKRMRDGKVFVDFEVIFDKNANILEVKNCIEKYCTSKTIPLSFVMYDGKYVHRVSVKNIIEHWYKTIYTTKARKINYQNSIYNHKKHVLEGMVVVYDHIDEIINLVKKSDNKNKLIEELSKKYNLTDIQSEAIANMSLYQLNKVSKDSLLQNIDDYTKKINDLDGKILEIDKEIEEDLLFIKKKYGTPRKTILLDTVEQIAEASGPIPISNGALLWSYNQIALFDLQNLVNGKTLTNGLKTIKINGKNVKEITGCHNVHHDIQGLIVFTTDGLAKRIETTDIHLNNWMNFADDPVISAVVPVFKEDDKLIVIMTNGKMKIIESNTITKSPSKVGEIAAVQVIEPGKDAIVVCNKTGGYHFIEMKDIPLLGRSASGIALNICSDEVFMTQIEMNSDDTLITTIRDSDGVSYITKTMLEDMEMTNRVNKPKKLITLDNEMCVSGLNHVDIRDKESKCILIGPYSSSQISMQNIRTSDMTKIPKRVPVNVLGIVTYKL